MQQNFQQLIEQLKGTLGKLGARKLIALGLVGAALMGAILYTSIYLSRPSYETLYVGLSRDDVNRMGLALGEAGIPFDVKADGSSILVPIGKAENARMYLAEKGLPTSNNAGYELFDNMGSLGLTSFMQEITRVRALEGEIARTIQAIRGVKAARVHIVMAEKARSVVATRSRPPRSSSAPKAALLPNLHSPSASWSLPPFHRSMLPPSLFLTPTVVCWHRLAKLPMAQPS